MKHYAIVLTKINGHKIPYLEGPYASSEIQKTEIRKMIQEEKEVYYLDVERNGPEKEISVGRVLMVDGDLNS